MHATLRPGLVIEGVLRRCGVAIGAPLGSEALTAQGWDAKSLMEFPRRKTYELSPTPIDAGTIGYEFN